MRKGIFFFPFLSLQQRKTLDPKCSAGAKESMGTTSCLNNPAAFNFKQAGIELWNFFAVLAWCKPQLDTRTPNLY